MSDHAKRRFWQLHLSTIIGMLAIALWLGALNWYSVSGFSADSHSYGWPVGVYLYNGFIVDTDLGMVSDGTWPLWLYHWLLPSVASWIAIISIPAFAWEWRLRRHAYRGLQIHLSTLLLLALITGVLLWINTMMKTAEIALQDGSRGVWNYYGWPSGFWSQTIEWGGLVEVQKPFRNCANLAIDSAVAFGILASCAWISESLIRRSEARNS